MAPLTAEGVSEIVDRVLIELEGDHDLRWEKVLGDCDSGGKPVDPRDDFEYCWDKIRAPVGDALESALRSALESPPTPDEFGEEFSAKRHTGFRHFLAFCGWLQERQGAEPIFTPLRDFAAVLDTGATQVHRWIDKARRKGFLEPIRPHSRHRAAEYRFHNPPLPV